MQIEVKGLSHVYSEGMPFETTAVSNVSFTAGQGEFIAIIGHTGSGKSTLSELICGLLKPSSGSVKIDGVDINEKNSDAKALRKSTGMVFQYPEYQLFEETILKDVCFGPKNLGCSDEEAETRARNALALVGLEEDVFDKSPFMLSGGQKRRVAIAGVLAMEPSVLVLDEPMAGLDPQGRREILSMIERIRTGRNITIFFVTHDMDAAAAMATRVFVMDGGKLVMDAAPREVFSNEKMLSEIGLGLPAPARLLSALKARGFDIRTDALNLKEACEWLSETLH